MDVGQARVRRPGRVAADHDVRPPVAGEVIDVDVAAAVVVVLGRAREHHAGVEARARRVAPEHHHAAGVRGIRDAVAVAAHDHVGAAVGVDVSRRDVAAAAIQPGRLRMHELDGSVEAGVGGVADVDQHAAGVGRGARGVTRAADDDVVAPVVVDVAGGDRGSAEAVGHRRRGRQLERRAPGGRRREGEREGARNAGKGMDGQAVHRLPRVTWPDRTADPNRDPGLVQPVAQRWSCGSGSIGRVPLSCRQPFGQSSKCRWGPVASPVAPTRHS